MTAVHRQQECILCQPPASADIPHSLCLEVPKTYEKKQVHTEE